jgi:hypothetical protein
VPVNLQHALTTPGKIRVCASQRVAAVAGAVGIAAMLVYAALSGNRLAGSLVEAADRPGWVHADVVEADSPRARAYADDEHVPVRLPDFSSAKLVLIAGRPRALLLPPSNALADKRDRALQAGAVLGSDRNVLLPVVSKRGERFDFIIRQDGEAMARILRGGAASQR